MARQTGSDIVKVWLADGTNYPGQDDMRTRRRHLIESLEEVYAALPANADPLRADLTKTGAEASSEHD